MAGHKINKQDRTYWQVNPADLKKHYKEVLPFLSLDQAKMKELKKMNIRQDPKEEEIAVLTKELAEIKEKSEERDKLLDEILTDPTILKKLYESTKKDQ